MSKQPPSAEALEIIDALELIAGVCPMVPEHARAGAAREIDALCQQRVSAETERRQRWIEAALRKLSQAGDELEAAGIVSNHLEQARAILSDPPLTEEQLVAFFGEDTRAPAERPAPEGPQPGDLTRWRGAFAPTPDDDTWDSSVPSDRASTGEQPGCGGTPTKRQLGFRDGMRRAVQWLHHRANHDMKDPHAKAILNSAATNLGWALSAGEFGNSAPPDAIPAAGSTPDLAPADPQPDTTAAPRSAGFWLTPQATRLVTRLLSEHAAQIRSRLLHELMTGEERADLANGLGYVEAIIKAALVEQADTEGLNPSAERRDGSNPSGGTSPPAAVVDYTERARALFDDARDRYREPNSLRDRLITDTAAALSAVASEHRAEIAALRESEAAWLRRAATAVATTSRVQQAHEAKLARLREPDVMEAVVAFLAKDDHNAYEPEYKKRASAILTKITEMLTP